MDRQRLGKQRVEAYQILELLAGVSTNLTFRNHPVVWMWKDSELVLMQYALTMCAEWRSRGFIDNMGEQIANLVQDALYQGIWFPGKNSREPWWLKHPGLHLSHRSNLIRKDPKFYQQYWPDVSPGLPYVWPEYRPQL